METIELVEQGIPWARSRIAGIGDAPLDGRTPCDQWDLRHLVNHTVNAAATIADVFTVNHDHDIWGRNARLPQEMADTEASWPNPVEEYDRFTQVIIDVARSSPDRTFLMSGVPQPPVMLARAIAFDGVIHGWDIAMATGQDPEMPTEVALALLEFAGNIPDRARGIAFGPRVEVPAMASPTDRLVALLGRTPT